MANPYYSGAIGSAVLPRAAVHTGPTPLEQLADGNMGTALGALFRGPQANENQARDDNYRSEAAARDAAERRAQTAWLAARQPEAFPDKTPDGVPMTAADYAHFAGGVYDRKISAGASAADAEAYVAAKLASAGPAGTEAAFLFRSALHGDKLGEHDAVSVEGQSKLRQAFKLDSDDTAAKRAAVDIRMNNDDNATSRANAGTAAGASITGARISAAQSGANNANDIRAARSNKELDNWHEDFRTSLTARLPTQTVTNTTGVDKDGKPFSQRSSAVKKVFAPHSASHPNAPAAGKPDPLGIR